MAKIAAKIAKIAAKIAKIAADGENRHQKICTIELYSMTF